MEFIQNLCSLIYKGFIEAIKVAIDAFAAIIRPAKIFIYKLIVQPLFILWHCLFCNHSTLISWNNEFVTKEITSKPTRYLFLTFFMLLSALVYIYLFPESSFIDSYCDIASPIFTTVGAYFGIITCYKKPHTNYITHSNPYRIHLGDIGTIDRRFASIDLKLSEQSRANKAFYTKTSNDLISLKEKQSKLMLQFNEFHTQLGLYCIEHRKIWQALYDNKGHINELIKVMADDLIERVLGILRETGGVSTFALEMSRMVAKKKYFNDLAQQNGATIADYLLQETKKFIQDQENFYLNETSISVYEADMEEVDNYALITNGAKIYFERTSSSHVDPEYWTRFLFGLAPLIERHAIKAIENDDACWSLKGPVGHLGILLHKTKTIKYISITHTSTDIETAPRNFEVYGVYRRGVISEEQFYIGEFQYKNINRRTQYFRINDGILPTRIILFRFKSNWGKNDRTDICRVGIYA
jgi:hypothetical protein